MGRKIDPALLDIKLHDNKIQKSSGYFLSQFRVNTDLSWIWDESIVKTLEKENLLFV